jgi:hypothetical protein
VHSCGSVPPHGAEQLKHPEPDFYTVGMKSYGRAPTFLLLTGYEQVRSVVAAIAGDWESARNVELVLPETGVCSTSNSDEASSCCSTTPPLISLDLGAPRRLHFIDFAPRATQVPVLAGQVNAVAQSNACCSTAEQTTCCAPSDKASCCGAESTSAGSTCGCK